VKAKFIMSHSILGFEPKHIYDVDVSYDTELNQYRCEASYDHRTGKTVDYMLYLSSVLSVNRYFRELE